MNWIFFLPKKNCLKWINPWDARRCRLETTLGINCFKWIKKFVKILLNEQIFTFYTAQRIAKRAIFLSFKVWVISGGRRLSFRFDHRQASSTPLLFCNAQSRCCFFFLTTFNCFKPCVRARARFMAWWGRKTT